MTMLGFETEYEDFIALLSSVNAEFQEDTGVLDISEDDESAIYMDKETVKTKDIIFTGRSALSFGTPCLRFNAETGKFLGGGCDDGYA